jgi:F-type H+-transporting ATPase subunit b
MRLPLLSGFRRGLRIAAFTLLAALALGARPVCAQEPAHESPAAHEGAAEEHAESIWPFVGKIFNFAVLAGALVYFLRTPIRDYLARRRSEVRSDLEAAQSTKTAAAAQIAQIEARMKALPAELEALRARGRADVEAEAQRIREVAAAERERLLVQADRDIDQKVRAARRDLVEHAADLTIGLARTQIEREMTDADRTRLVDRYLAQVTSHE